MLLDRLDSKVNRVRLFPRLRVHVKRSEVCIRNLEKRLAIDPVAAVVEVSRTPSELSFIPDR
jgi:hypothetical protein